ncbi:hypothetical protein QE369_003011 [Agrobacterium larrymoorei]|uniref:DUF930 domain-containing protein n=1 Tax=Agrobacterium larrymoorei TaxID=160699 RepID=A0AAJ2BHD2_9HYPH|nr:DUF930 domain-containing protein [Agrobacterium larrymoorei]MDR6102814.1 hypothetical protein [Agrobacterium larrymoorei]
MEKPPTKIVRQGISTIPISLLLHVLVIGSFYFQLPGQLSKPPEPESVSVELVDPPKAEPPPEKKAEEAKKPESPPPPPPPKSEQASSLPSVAIRPDKTQLDERDEPGKQTDEGGQEQPKPGEGAVPEAQKSVTVAEPEAQAAPQAPSPPTPVPSQNAATGEIAASETPPLQDQVATVVPAPKPDPKEVKPAQADSPASGEGNPQLKPAKKLLASGKRPKPMLRQIMGKLSPEQRVAQLCIAETMAQIKESRGAFIGLQPHTAKNYPISGNLMNAKGAFNVGNNKWFAVDYRCEVDIDKYIVTDFRFHIGDQLAPEDVKRLKLPEG